MMQITDQIPTEKRTVKNVIEKCLIYHKDHGNPASLLNLADALKTSESELGTLVVRELP